MKKQSQGITLIALVITIIVLLILAGVSISMVAGDNGVAQKAADAKEKTNAAKSDEEQKLQDALDYIDSNVSGNILAVGTEVTGSNRTLTGGTATYKNPIIPVGFKAVNDGASWEVSGEEITGWNEGLVIEDADENQFVWVPVDGTNVTYEKWCAVTNGGSKTYENVSGDDTLSGINEIDQINKYGGFWIGRYEAGRSDLDSTSQTTNNVSTGVDLLIQKGAQTWNFISYANAKIVAESYVNNANVKSGLLTGTQWDTTMKWIQNAGFNVTTDSDEWGIYYSTTVTGNGRYSKNATIWQTGEFSKTGSGSWILGTGLYENGNANNIYDLAGNLYEWTAEKYGTQYVFRSGGQDSSGISASRFYLSSNDATSLIGFRVVLYVM